MRTRWTRLVPAYLLLAAFATWPAVAQLGRAVPGSAHTDLWDSLWSLWFFSWSLGHGHVPFATDLLNAPVGGVLLVSDLPGAAFTAGLIPLMGLASAYTLLVLAEIAWSGIAAHRFAEDVAFHLLGPEASAGAGWVAGVGYATAPVLLCGVHNGNSESFGFGWAALAAHACWRVAIKGGRGRIIAAGLALLLAILGNAYGAVVAFLFAGAIALFPPPGGEGSARARWGALCLGLALAMPVAWGVNHAATEPDNLVGIKNPRELMLVRRTTGPADPIAYFMPGDYRSPDFRVLSRYGEDFFHCPYLGWTLLCAAFVGGRGRRRGLGAITLAGVLGAILSLGPVLARKGDPVMFLDDRALPLPYFLVERLPGFSSLSLVYRLAQGPALALAIAAGVGLAGRRRWVLPVIAAVLLEGRFVSPMAGLPETSDTRLSPAFDALAAAPAGAVMNFPVVGGRSYLYEQSVHHHPEAATLNFPNNSAAKKAWQAMLDATDATPEAFRQRVAERARRSGVRYVVVHRDPLARPDMHDAAVRALAAAMSPLAEGTAPGGGDDSMIQVYALW